MDSGIPDTQPKLVCYTNSFKTPREELLEQALARISIDLHKAQKGRLCLRHLYRRLRQELRSIAA